jgi:hypothetical protein
MSNAAYAEGTTVQLRTAHSLQQSFNHTMNSRVSSFLPKPEYYQGLMFLTKKRVKNFDDVIQSRITLAFKYQSLSLKIKRTV